MSHSVSTPTIPSFQARAPGERSISAWKTRPFESRDGRQYVIITEGSDNNTDVLNRIVEVVRYEFNGGKIIYKTPIQTQPHSHSKT